MRRWLITLLFTAGFPSLKTPMVIISLSGAEMGVRTKTKAKAGYVVKAGGFHWLQDGQSFVIKNKQNVEANGLLILLK